MDGGRPLSAGEKLYWSFFAGVGPTGLAYELYVRDNRGSLLRAAEGERAGVEGLGMGAEGGVLVRGNHGMASHMFVEDEAVTDFVWSRKAARQKKVREYMTDSSLTLEARCELLM